MRQELTALLLAATERSTFVSQHQGEFRASQLRAAYPKVTSLDVVNVLPAEPHPPADLLEKLTDSFGSLLADYVVAGQLRFELAYLLGGPPQITVEEFARRSIRASAFLGAERALDMILGWVEGGSFEYRRLAVISGLSTSEPFEWQGMHFSSLPEGALRDHVPIGIVDGLGSDSLSRAVKMSVPCELRPAFHVPGPSDQVPLRESDATPPLNKFSEALSLQCNSHVVYKAEWTHYGDLLAFEPRYGKQWGFNLPPHDLEVHGLPPDAMELTEENLAGAMSLLLKLVARDDLRDRVKVAIHRWMKSKRDIDYPDQSIELRIALEALYATNDRDP